MIKRGDERKTRPLGNELHPEDWPGILLVVPSQCGHADHQAWELSSDPLISDVF